jgi:hypothetical protein
LGPPQAEARHLMDIYDSADWTEIMSGIDADEILEAAEGEGERPSTS